MNGKFCKSTSLLGCFSEQMATLSKTPDFSLCLLCVLQMTGLDIEKDQIIEMACIITDSDLNVLVEVT